jgi:hypothetical protein
MKLSAAYGSLAEIYGKFFLPPIPLLRKEESPCIRSLRNKFEEAIASSSNY